MDIYFHEKLYRKGISVRRLASIKKKIQKKSPKLSLFLITKPMTEQGILEVYWYPELLQQVYQQMDVKLTVVGVTRSRRGAFLLIKQIINDVGFDEGKIRIDQFFREN